MIPEGWEQKQLIDVAKRNRYSFTGGPFGSNLKAEDYTDSGVRIIQLQNIGDGRFLDDYKIYTSVEKADELISCNIYPGDIILSKMGDPVARAAFIPNIADRFLMASDGIRLEVDESKYAPRYILEYINSPYFRINAIRQSIGSTRQRINLGDLKRLPILIPPFPEQRAIGAILGTWDSAIALTERRLAAAEQRRKALMQQLLTGRVRFPEFTGEAWRETALGEFLTMRLRKVVKPSDLYLALGIRSHGKGTFHKEVADPDEVAMSHLYRVKTGDLIVNITFAWEGAIAIVGENDDGRLVSHRFPTYVFNRAKVEPDFFKHLMLTKCFFYELGLISPGGAGRNRVMSKRDFLRIKVKLPSLQEQKRCAAILCAADKEVELLTKKRDALQAQKKGLMQRLLTGRVRIGISI